MHSNRTPSLLARCFELFQSSLDQLHVKYTFEQLEGWMLGIHYAMTTRSRSFHQLDHVLDVGRGLQPLQAIAALYHDVVYFQVDHGFTPVIQQKFSDAVVMRDNHFYVGNEGGDARMQLVREIFDFSPGQELNVLGGLNEFLSAVVATHDLGEHLSKIQMATVVACIRATIPFQGLDSAGQTFPMRIASTLEKVSKREKWKCTTAMIHSIVREAVEVGNADVANFGSEDLSAFLDNTWKLLPEVNPSLHSLRANTIQSYRISLENMERFMSHLDPGLVFHNFEKFPEPAAFAAMTQAAGKNISQAVDYLRAKLVTMAMLEGIASLTGGDAPIVLLAGASREEEPSAMQMRDFLGEPHAYRTRDFDGINEVVYHVLKVGRSSATHFDSKSSPITAFIYTVLGKSALERHFDDAQKAIQGGLSWLDFLKSFPGSLVKEMVEAAAKISVVRATRCQELAKRL